jgi:hypothetical protein
MVCALAILLIGLAVSIGSAGTNASGTTTCNAFGVVAILLGGLAFCAAWIAAIVRSVRLRR